MGNINYFVLTVADCEASYRNTMVGHVKMLAQELLDDAGAVRVRVGVIGTGDNPGAVLLVQAYETIDGFEKAMDVYAKSAAYADFVASGKVQIRLRNLVKTHPVPLLDNMAKLAKVFEDAGACTLAYGTIITGSNAGNRLLGITYPSMSAIEAAYDMLGSDADYQALLEDVDINMWWQCYQKNEGHRPHAHGEADFGSTLFLNFLPGIHSPTRFYAPFNNYLTGNVLEFEKKDIKEGDIIFFPASIIHESPINKSVEPKKIIAMNLNVPKLVQKFRSQGL